MSVAGLYNGPQDCDNVVVANPLRNELSHLVKVGLPSDSSLNGLNNITEPSLVNIKGQEVP